MREKLEKIKVLAMDIDGTLTDGTLVFHGESQIKLFNVYDGLGIRLAMNAGLAIAWVTGNISDSVTKRAESLGLKEVYQGSRFKAVTIKEIAEKHGITTDEIAFVGDDINDIPALRVCGFAVAVANAVPEVKAIADYITETPGSKGAVREVIELILKTQGRWDDAVEAFLAMLEREQAAKSEGPGVN
ncbi:MAG: HAD hydrolase family protein [Abditibacteriota bacterium]|nr:HAD hydrolase family protein [Abditibacteriota bacterium]